MTAKTRPKPRRLPSMYTKLQMVFGNLHVTVSMDEDSELYAEFGCLGKGGSY